MASKDVWKIHKQAERARLQGKPPREGDLPLIGQLALLILVAAAIAALMSGCAGTFRKPGVTQEQANRDRYECEQEAYAAQQNRPMYMVNALYRDCMKARGYTK